MSFGLIGTSLATAAELSATTAAAVGAGASFLGSSTLGGETATSATEQFTKGTRTTQLQLEPEAIDKLISDVLGSETGLAEIFSQENVAGIFDSTVAAQASGDLVANLVGEIAKLTGKTVETTDEEITSTATGETTDPLAQGEAGLDAFRKLLNLDVAPIT